MLDVCRSVCVENAAMIWQIWFLVTTPMLWLPVWGQAPLKESEGENEESGCTHLPVNPNLVIIYIMTIRNLAPAFYNLWSKWIFSFEIQNANQPEHASRFRTLIRQCERENHPLVAMSAATCDERLRHRNTTVSPN